MGSVLLFKSCDCKPLYEMYNVPGSAADGQVDSFHYLDYILLVFECEG